MFVSSRRSPFRDFQSTCSIYDNRFFKQTFKTAHPKP